MATDFLRNVVLFDAILLWVTVLYAVSRRRDHAAGTACPAGALASDIAAIAAGVILRAAFAFWVHTWLIGVNPLA